MAMDFPSAPTVGQKYPASPVAGVPTYTWDGAKWTTIGAPMGGKSPVYIDGTNAMTAALVLAGDPVNSTDAADKHYVDNAIATNVPPPAFPSGTVMLFYQAAAPTGWTKLTTQNDKALRVVSGSGGVAGGTNAFSTVMAQSVVGNHTLATSEIPPGITSTNVNNIVVYPGGDSTWYFPINHGSFGAVQTFQSTGYWVPYSGDTNASLNGTTNSQANNNIGVYSSGGGGAHNHPITMAIQYIDVILASKN
jgi:hypothetical protein